MTDRPRLLLVDDDRAITSTVAPLLRGLADVDSAHSVAEALEKLAAHTYAGCVLDLVLGDDASPLHDALSSREVPTLLISGRDPDALSRVASARGWSYAAKPLAPDVLRGLVADLVGVDAPEPTQRGRIPSDAPKADASKSTLAQPVSVQLLDKLGDLVAMVCVAYLCAAGKLSGELAAAIIAGVAGVGTTARAITGRSVGVATGAVALAALLTASTAQAHDTARPTRSPVPPPAAMAALLLALALVASGCVSAPDAPTATLDKILGWVDTTCGAARSAVLLARDAVASAPKSDAGVDASAGSPGDASVSAESDGGDQ